MIFKHFLLPRCSKCGSTAEISTLGRELAFKCIKCEVIEIGKWAGDFENFKLSSKKKP